MSYITQSLARQTAIMNRNNAEYEVIRANQAQQNLAGSKGDFNSVSRKEAQIEARKEQAKTKAEIAYATQKALRNSKHKVDCYA